MKITDGVLEYVEDNDIIDGKFEIPEGITEIGEEAFYECHNLVDIIIPKGVTKIGEEAFCGCDSLKEVTIPKGVTEIGYAAFDDCISLLKIEIPEGVTTIKASAFAGCTNLEKITIPKGVTKIEHKSFYGCTNLSNIIIPEGVTIIEGYAFSGCERLLEITVPEGVTTINGYAFARCTNLEKVIIPKGVEIESWAFNDCTSLLKVTIPKGSKIHDWSFQGCTGLLEIIIPEGITEIDCFDYNDVAYDQNKKVTILKNGKKSKSSKFIPKSYFKLLISRQEEEDFITNADFRAFNSNIQNLKELLSKYPAEEQMDFFKFAVSLGCFSTEKIVDKNGKETEVTVGQKASALLAKLIKTPELRIGQYHGLFTSLPIEAKASKEFLDFITPQGKKNDNLELLTSIENECPGIFAKVMNNFEKVQEYRNTIAKDGTPKTVPWEEALKKYYFGEKYTNVTEETRDIADLYSHKGINQRIFDKAVELRTQAKENGVPEQLLGKEIRELSILEEIENLKSQTAEELANSKELIDDLYSRQFTYEWLNKNDPRNAILGLYASCCGTITSIHYGRFIAESSIIQKDVQNLVVRDVKGEIIAKGTIYVNEKQGYGVFNDFELNKKYREHEHFSGIYDGDNKEESELTESEKAQRKERDLIFSAFQRGIKAFTEEYDKQHPDKPLQQINVGMGYNRLKRNVEKFEEATELLSVPIEYDFQDAGKKQHILYKRDNGKEQDNITQEKEER